ncbi:hypothetical protein N431DRAFT_473570 [Stipitochalara longipes BDJ]|nr:hypothetical protein N431DRAFT_473570 [Stipitochalara longipes BDJ]
MSRLKSFLKGLAPLSIPRPPFLLETFTLFPKLAPEIRDMIWSFAALEPRKVNLLSTLSDPEPRLKSAVEGQSRQPVVMEVCRESRDIGKKYYELVSSVPRKICVRRGEVACPRCIYDAWNAAPGRGYRKRYWIGDDVEILPEEIRELLRDQFGVVPAHEPHLSAKGDFHWVSFEIDEFVLKLSGSEPFTTVDRRYYFNFRKEDAKKIKRLAFSTETCLGEVLILNWTLGGVLKWMELQELTVGIVRMKPKSNEAVAMGDVGLELSNASRRTGIKSYFTKNLSLDAKKKLHVDWVVADEDKNS